MRQTATIAVKFNDRYCGGEIRKEDTVANLLEIPFGFGALCCEMMYVHDKAVFCRAYHSQLEPQLTVIGAARFVRCEDCQKSAKTETPPADGK